MTEPGEPVEVLSGTADGGLRWVVVTSGTDQDLYTMLNVYRDDQLLGGSGFAGPKLYPGSVMNEWRGQKDDLPWFVMARTDPTVDRVVAATSVPRGRAGYVSRGRAVRPAVRGRRTAGGGVARPVAGRTRRYGHRNLVALLTSRRRTGLAGWSTC